MYITCVKMNISKILQDRKKDNSTPEAHRKRANSYVNFDGIPMQVSFTVCNK